MKGITIDGATSKDLDDAIWVEKTVEGVCLLVHIANVAGSIFKGSGFDQKAFDLVETRYFEGEKNYPMLPRKFSEDELSLLEGKERDVFTIRVVLHTNLAVRNHEFITGKLTSQAKLSHAEIPDILKDEKHPFHEVMKLAEVVARGLMERRRSNGAFVFYDLNQGWMTTEEGFVRKVKDTEETIGQIIVQEFMILANHQMARYCAEHEIPVLWRNHTAKAHAPKRADLVERLSTSAVVSEADLQVMRQQVHMVMNRAEYGAVLEGHYGLNLPGYLHCTSPIRRFADLVTQRQLVARAERKDYPYSREELEQLAEHINTKIQAARDKRSQYEIEKVTQKAQESLSGGVIARAEGKEYERIVKVMVRSGEWSDEFAADFLERLKEDNHALLALYFVLLQSNREDEQWNTLRQPVLDYLAEHLWHVPSLISIAMTLSGWSEPYYRVDRLGPDHALQHSAKVKVTWKSKKRDDLKGKGTGSSQAVAKQRAGLDLLARFLKLKAPEWEAPKPSTVPTQEVPAIPGTVEDAVSALNLWCQGNAVSTPTYSAEHVGGPPHAPQFVGTCHLGDEEALSDPMRSKKAAKQQAAQRMLERLRG